MSAAADGPLVSGIERSSTARAARFAIWWAPIARFSVIELKGWITTLSVNSARAEVHCDLL